MNAFNITHGTETSEWLTSMTDVQIESDRLEKLGIMNITVNKFVLGRLDKSVSYSFNGQGWERS